MALQVMTKFLRHEPHLIRVVSSEEKVHVKTAFEAFRCVEVFHSEYGVDHVMMQL